MTLTILNDKHLGANRTGGTTPQTAWQLRQDLLDGFERLLAGTDTDLQIQGDLFDGALIPRADWTRAFSILYRWISDHRERKVWLVAGNHDLSKDSTKMSDFQGLGMLLAGLFPENVTYVEGALLTPYGYIISHVPNQELFDLELAKVPECPLLFVHCNYDNKFAQEADHSLNLSREQAEKLPVQHIVFAHEHQSKTALADKVVIIGNQLPSSVSDCLGNSVKQCLTVDIDAAGEPQLAFVETWKAEGDFSEQHWTELEDRGRFIRVVGEVKAHEADQFVKVMARFRRDARALVITNAAKIEGVADADQLVLTHEQVSNFNVREALRELLDPAENKKVDDLLEKHPC